jgi:hypothetical protein
VVLICVCNGVCKPNSCRFGVQNSMKSEEDCGWEERRDKKSGSCESSPVEMDAGYGKTSALFYAQWCFAC